jgi:RNA polymerase sigma-70 factor (ECF subfamily)
MNRNMPIESEDLSKERLLRLAAQGDKQAFGRLYELHLDEIYRYVFFKIGDPLDAEDITENVFLKAWEGLSNLDNRGKVVAYFRPWIYRIALNLVIDFYRAKKPILKSEIATTNDLSPEDITTQTRLSQRLAKAIRKLEPKYQEIIILRFINQLSHKEAAIVMNLNHNHTRILQYRAIKKLKLILTGEDN